MERFGGVDISFWTCFCSGTVFEVSFEGDAVCGAADGVVG